jgi:hypothetical protein
MVQRDPYASQQDFQSSPMLIDSIKYVLYKGTRDFEFCQGAEVANEVGQCRSSVEVLRLF